MKALSLWQPWASLVILTQKHETRSWPTSYRGDLLICSTAKTPLATFAKETTHPRIYEKMKAATFREVRTDPRSGWSYPTSYPDGAALGVVELFDCLKADEWQRLMVETDEEHLIQPQRDMGDIDSPGRWIWLFRNRRILANPVKIVGGQRIWNTAPGEIATILPQLVGLEGRRCRTCQQPAQCVGYSLEPADRLLYEWNCGYHCGHGNEDGRCWPVSVAAAGVSA